MSRYVDADVLIRKIQEGHKFGSLTITELISECPTADVVSREEYDELKRENEFLKRMQRSLTKNMSNQKLGLIVKENL